MPAPAAPLIGFSLGVLFAWAASRELARTQAQGTAGRALVSVMLFALLVFAPIVGYFVAFETDWAFAYIVNAKRLPEIVTALVALVALGSVPLGFVAAARFARARRFGPVARLGAIPALLALAFVFVARSRLSVEASYAQYHGDFGTRAVAGGPLGYALLWMLAVLSVSAMFTVQSLRRFGRE